MERRTTGAAAAALRLVGTIAVAFPAIAFPAFALPAIALPIPLRAVPLPAVGQQSPPVATPTAAWQVLEAAAERYRGVQATCADFEQVVDVRLLGRRVESAGRVCQQRPNLFSMRFSDPDGDAVVSDGEHFWVYYPSLDTEQVVRYHVAGSPGGYDFYREFLDDPAAKYTVRDGGTEQVDDRDCRIVELAPTDAGAYQRARLWLDVRDHTVRRLEVHHENGSVRTLSLRNLDLAPALGSAYFAFRVPEGARVMDGPARPGG